MNTVEVGTKFVAMAKEGKGMEIVDTLFSPDIVSVEAASMPNMPAEMKGLDAVKGKSQWWRENHIVHSAEVVGPFPNGDRFAVRFTYDVTNKPANRRMTMDEVALYTVRNGKIVREEFFYTT